MLRLLLQLLAFGSGVALVANAYAQAPVPRPTPVAGTIVAAKGGEELRLVREADWRSALLQQDLIGGDTLRTNAIGNLAILFADQTQIRVGRNSSLIVNEVAGQTGTTELELQSGNIWARASRGGTGVDVKTPAAVAAIRGTDWSLAVDGSGRTSLVVLEGVVELRNPQGSVTVRQGEGAVAAIGQAPTKFVLVSPNDREQMLFYLTLRDAFRWLPATTLRGPAQRAEHARLRAIAADRRSPNDWLAVAELALALDGRAAAADALAEARRRPLSAPQRARADLVEAILLAGDRHFAQAAAVFARAQRGLDRSRGSSAAYGRYIAASLADPRRVQSEPAGANDATAALARAFLAGFQKDLAAAAELARAAEQRFPDDARIASFSAQLAIGLDRRADVMAALQRARSIDPDDPLVLETAAIAKAELGSEINSALADLRRAAAAAPGQSSIWNYIGLYESERDASSDSEAAFRRAITEDPSDPVPRANLAILLLDQNRVAEAGLLIEQALAIDPAFHVGFIAKGRYLLQTGDMAGAMEATLKGTTANPALAQGLLLQAVAAYQNGDIEQAEQALDNAERLDPNDYVVSIARTAIAIDRYRADEAVTAGREAVRRSRARGGDFAGLAASRQSGSYPAEAYRFIGLNEWSRFYGDRVFDPFTASGYFDQSANLRPSLLTPRPTIGSVEAGGEADLSTVNLVLQGLLFDPLAVGSRIGRIDLLRRPFLDAEVGGSAIHQDGRIGWQTDARVQGYTNTPIPTAFSLSASRLDLNARARSLAERADNASLFVGFTPTPVDRVVLFGAVSQAQPGLAIFGTPFTSPFEPASLIDQRQETTTGVGVAQWSHTLGYRNVVNVSLAALSLNDRRFEERLDYNPFVLSFAQTRSRIRTEGALAAANHTIGFGDLSVRYGLEAQGGRVGSTQIGSLEFGDLGTGDGGVLPINERERVSFSGGRAYGDLLWRPSDWFEAQAGLHRTLLDTSREAPRETFLPRLAIGLSPIENHWLRAGYIRDAAQPIAFTLSPITTLGLVPIPLPTNLSGQVNTVVARWDAEWSPRVFSAAEYQRHDVRGLELPIDDTLQTIGIERARIESASATGNLWLGNGIGVFATVGATGTKVRSAEAPGDDVPFIAGRFARAGLTLVHPSRLRLTVSETYVGERTGDLTGRSLDAYWTTDAALTWETPDRHVLFGVTALNLFDRRYELAPGIAGAGRTIAATLKARF